MAMASATIGGITILNTEKVGWSFTPGLEPHQRVFTIAREDMDAALALRDEPFGVDLEFKSGNDVDQDWVVHRLFVLRAVPTKHPQMAAVLVSDVRWKWKYKWITRRYNVKRNTGDRYLASTDDTVLTAAQINQENIIYAPYSLRPDTNYEKIWEARDVVRDVFGTVTEFSYVDSNNLYDKQIEVEGLEIDDDGVGSIQRIMYLIPGAQCIVDEQGVTQVYNFADGRELEVAQNLGAQFVGSTLIEPISMSMERPSKIHVHFTTEQELRFDFIEGATVDTDGRFMRNVMPMPINTTLGGKSIAAGTWVEITDTLLAQFAAKYPPVPVRGRNLPTLTLQYLRRCWMNGDYNFWYDGYSGSDASSDPVWAMFLDSITQHYRQTFQVNQRWADRIIEFIPKRVALLDPVNNVWGTPWVFTNYSLIPSYRRLGKSETTPTDLAYVRKAFDPPSGAAAVELATIQDKKAQATVKVLDPRLGIFHISFFAGRSGDFIKVVPSELVGFDPSTNSTTTLPDAGVRHPLKVASHCSMADQHALSIVLTVMVGAPNSLDQTWDEDVDLTEAKSVLPEAVAKLLPDAKGPEMHVRAQVENARFSWSDNPPYTSAIENSILRDGGKNNCALLMVNRDKVQAVARSMAANIYASMVDHIEGAAVVRINPDLMPKGRVSLVEHSYNTDGVATTKVTFPPPSRSGFTVWSLMPEFVRRILKRQLPR